MIHRRSKAADRKSSGVMLLEVLLALTLFVIAAAVVGSATQSSIRAITRMRQENKAVNLAQSVLAELSAGVLEVVDTPASSFQEGEAGEVIEEGWTYEIVAEDLPDVAGLKRVTVIVTNPDLPQPQTQRLTQWMFDPAAAAEAEAEFEELGP